MYAQGLRLDDLQWQRRPFDGARVYAQAKRAQVSLMREWARRIPSDEVTFAAMHPGWTDTPGISAALPRFYGLMGPLLRTPAQGADTTVWLAADPAAAGTTVNGRLFLDRRPRPFDRVPSDPGLGRRPPAAVGCRGRPGRRRGSSTNHPT